MNKNQLLVPIKVLEHRNIILVENTWDQNDADYETKYFELDPENFFKNDKLINILAYITTPTAPFGENSHRFGNHVNKNKDIDDIMNILEESGFVIRTLYLDDNPAHSVEEIKMTYYDENGNTFNISFENVRKAWDNMTHEEICDYINKIPK